MKKIFLASACLICFLKIYSQNDTLTTLDINKILYPGKLLTVNYYWCTPTTLNSNENIVLDGLDLNNNQGYHVNGILPIYSPRKKSFVRVLVDYDILYTSFKYSDLIITDSELEIDKSDRYKTKRYTITPSIIFNYKLWNRDVTSLLKLNLNSYTFFDPSYYSALFVMNFSLHNSKQKKSSIGIAYIHSEERKIPLVVYSLNKFMSTKWTLEMTLPYSVGIRRIQNEKLNIKSNLKIDVLSSMFKPQYYSEVSRFEDLGLSLDLKAEYKVFKHLMWYGSLSYKYAIKTSVKYKNGDSMQEFDPNSKLFVSTGFSFILK